MRRWKLENRSWKIGIIKNMRKEKKIVNFTDLESWQEAHKLVLAIYEVIKKFPKEEMFGLSNQIRRAGISVTSNITEGFGRRSLKEKIKFYSIAQGALTEIQNQLLIAKDAGYISKQKFEEIFNQIVKIQKFLNGLIKKSKSFLSSSSFELPASKGTITIYALIFGTVFLILLGGVIGFILFNLNLIEKRIAWHKAFDIAEAGIEYYKWCINNNLNCDLEKEYTDINGNAIGKFKIEVQTNSNCAKVISHQITSTGWTYKFPEIKRKISVLYARESVAKYAYIFGTNVWMGPDEKVKGPFHSNEGVRFDGENSSIVSSAVQNWECTNSFGCGPSGVGYGEGLCPPECQRQRINQDYKCMCPGVFSTTQNSKRDLFLFPIPQFDFTGITADLNQIKNAAQNSGGIYLPPAKQINTQGKGWHLKFFVDNVTGKPKVEAKIVTQLSCTCGYSLEYDEFPYCGVCAWNPSWCSSENGYYQWNCFTITSEAPYQTFTIPSSCSVIFVEDNLWPEGTIKEKVTVASANLIDPNKTIDVILNYNLDYAGTGNDGLTLISQRNIFIGPDSPEYMTLKGIFIAQNGRITRNYYRLNIKEQLTIYGSWIATITGVTTWVSTGGIIISGYKKTDTSIDPNLLYNPPVFTPYLTSQFKKMKWEEK